MPIVEKFLCFDLFTGGYAIGTFEIFLHMFLLAFSGFNLTHSMAKENYVIVILIGEMVIFSLNLLASVFLIFGTAKKDVRMIFPYLVTSVLVLLTIIIQLISMNWQFVPLTVYTCYTFVCVLSLCQQIREDKLRKKLNNYDRTPTQE